MWPFGKREVHFHLDAALLRDVRPGDVLVIALNQEWSRKTVSQFVEFVEATRALPEGARVLLVPSDHAPILLRAQPEPQGQKDADDGDQ